MNNDYGLLVIKVCIVCKRNIENRILFNDFLSSCTNACDFTHNLAASKLYAPPELTS